MKMWIALLLCAGTAHGAEVKLVSSRTMTQMNTMLAARYATVRPADPIRVDGSGTDKAFEALTRGTADIAAVTRKPDAAETRNLKKAGGTAAPVIVGYEGITIYLHPRNRVTELTKEQLTGIFTGRITNWKDLGGGAAPINVYSFDDGTGRYWYFLLEVLANTPLAKTARYTDKSAPLDAKIRRMLEWVAGDPNGIGYGGIGRVRMVNVAKIRIGKDAVLPTPMNIQSGRYPYARMLGFLVRDEKHAASRAFVSWAKAQEDLIRSHGFVPAP